MNTSFAAPNGKIKSNMEQIFQAMQVFTPPVKNWSVQRRNTKLVANSVRATRAADDLKMKKLVLKETITNHGKKSFLVCRKRLGFICPIGFSKNFKKIEEVIKFAKENGREIVRVVTGAVGKNYQVN